MQKVLVRLLAHHERCGRLHILDPLVGLPLWVDAERPAEGGGEDEGVLGGEAVGGQALCLPLAQLYRVCHHLVQRRPLCVRHAERSELRTPVGAERLAIRSREGAEVRDVARRQADVANQVGLLRHQARHRLLPPNLCAVKAANELLGALELVGAVNGLGLELLLLVDRPIVLTLQRRELVLDLLDLYELLVEILGHLGVLGLRCSRCFPLGRHSLGDIVVGEHRAHPGAEAEGGLRRLLDRPGHEELVGEVLLADLVDDRGRDVVLVVGAERGEELGAVHHLHGGVPVVVHLALAVGRGDLDGRHVHHHADGLHCELDGCLRRRTVLQLVNVRLLERIERRHGCIERGERLG